MSSYCDQGCHEGDFADFDHYMDEHGLQPEEAPAAFAAWLHNTTGWDGPMYEVEMKPEDMR